MVDIDTNILEKAPPCVLGRVCLSGDMSCSCMGLQDKGNYLLVDPPEIFNIYDCPYSQKDKNTNLSVFNCSCPVRKEIYRKYGK